MTFMRATRILTIVSALLLSLAAATRALPERYVIDPDHSYVGFTVRHLMVTNVKGKFKSFSGEINLDSNDIRNSKVDVSIETASVSTDVDRRDNHLRSDAFFDAAHYPTMRFVGKRVEKKGNRLTLVGDLTIKDVTKEVAIPFELNGPVRTADGGKRLGAEGTLTINRFDYGLKYNRVEEAVAVVAPDVRIELNIEANTPKQ